MIELLIGTGFLLAGLLGSATYLALSNKTRKDTAGELDDGEEASR